MSAELKNQALHFLQNQHLLHLATLNDNNHPEVASVFYYCYDDFRLVFSTRSSTRKSANLAQCEHVGFSVTNETELISIQGMGTAKVTHDPVKIGQMLMHLAGIGFGSLTELWPPPVHKIKGGEYVVVEITPTWLRLGDFRDSHPTEDYYSQII